MKCTAAEFYASNPSSGIVEPHGIREIDGEQIERCGREGREGERERERERGREREREEKRDAEDKRDSKSNEYIVSFHVLLISVSLGARRQRHHEIGLVKA